MNPRSLTSVFVPVAASERPVGVMLAENIELMQSAGQPFCTDEITRIGRAICDAVTDAESRNIAVAAKADRIFIAPDGAVSVVGSPPVRGQVPAPFSEKELVGDLAKLLIAMLNVAPGGPPESSTRSSSLVNRITKFSNGSGSLRKLKAALAPRKTKSLAIAIRTSLFVATAIILIIQFKAMLKVQDPGNPGAATEAILHESLNQAVAAQAQWNSFSLAHPGLTPPQTEEADHEFQLATDTRGALKNDEAQAHYGRATDLYNAGLAAAHGMEVKREQSLASRARIDTALLRWRPVLRSSYVELPPQIQGGLDALVEGNLRFLQSRFEDALVAYDLAEQRVSSVPGEQLDRLLARNDAMGARDAARAAQESWSRLAQATDLMPPPAVAVAKTRQAEGEALLSAGRDKDAAERLRSASGQFRLATDSVIAAIVAREGAADLKTRATEAMTRWRAVATAMKQENSPEAVQAQTLMNAGADASKRGDFAKAEQTFDQAAKMIEAQYQKLNSVAQGRVVKLEERIGLLQGSLVEAERDLNGRIAKAEQRVAAIQQRLGLPAAGRAQPNPTVEEEFAIAAMEKLQLSKQSRFCSTQIFAGPRRHSTDATLTKVRELRLQGDYTAACVLMEQCVSELEVLSRLPSESEAFLSEESQVVRLKTSIPPQLGPIARASLNVVNLQKVADESLQQAAEMFRNGKPVEGRQQLGDATMALQSLVVTARKALIEVAKEDEASLRFDDAEAALHEEMTIDPAPADAQRLLETIRSLRAQLREQITLLQGKLRVGNNALAESPVFKDFQRILGEPSRRTKGNVSYIYDNRGLVLIPDVGSEHIRTMMIYFTKPQLPHEPSEMYKGLFEIDGYSIGRAVDAIDKINAAITKCRFDAANAVDGAFRAQYGSYAVRINYEPNQSNVAVIAVDFRAAAP